MKKIIKKGKKHFPPFGRFFDHFLVATLPEKMIKKCFGVKEEEWREKKCNFKNNLLSAFFRHNVSEKRSVCG